MVRMLGGRMSRLNGAKYKTCQFQSIKHFTRLPARTNNSGNRRTDVPKRIETTGQMRKGDAHASYCG